MKDLFKSGATSHLCVIVPTLNRPSSIGTPNQNVNYSISSPHHYLNGELIVKRISWTIIAALVATLFLPVNAAQALTAGQLTCVKSQVILSGSIAVATDSQGNIYTAESGGHLVRKVDATTGDTTIIAGTGESGLSGDGGLAINAKLKRPKALAISGTTLWIADSGNGRIRKVNLETGVISAFANSDGPVSIQVTNNFVYVSGNPGVVKFSLAGESLGTVVPNSGDNATAVDSNGNLFVTKPNSKQVVKMGNSDEQVIPFAGTGEDGGTGDGGLATAATFNSVSAIAIDSSNNVYISDTTDQVIRKVNASDGKISTFATGVKAVTLAMVNSGTMIFGEFNAIENPETGESQITGKIGTINLQTKAISNLTGGSPYLYELQSSGVGGLLKNANLPEYISGFYIDPSTNDFYLSNWLYQSIQRVSGTTGILSIYAGNHPRNLGSKLGEANEVNIFLPTQLAKGPDGNFYYGDQENRLYKIDKTSKIVTKVAGGGQETTEGGLAVNARLEWSRSIAFDSFGNLYTADPFLRQIKKITTNGQIFTIAGTGENGYSGDGGPATGAKLNFPNAIVIDSQDNLYFADQGQYGNSSGGVIRKIDLRAATPTITRVAGRGSNTGFAFNGLATDANFGGGLVGDGNMAMGPDGNLYWAEEFEGQRAVRSLDLSTGPNAGKISTVLLNAGRAIAFDKDGKLLLAERGSIFKFDKTTNTISLVAGSPGATTIGGSLVTNLKVGCNLVPQVVISVGSTPNSQVATIPDGQTRALIPATAVLPAITLDFSGTSPTAVTVAPVASNPATPTRTPFKILGSTKIVDITPTGTFTGSATVCLDGASTDSIFHFTGGQWVELPSRTYANGQVCGVTTSFSPFAAAEKQALAPAPVVVYVPPTPVPYLKTLTDPKINLLGDMFVCTAGTYNSGYTLDGVIQGSATALYTPANYTFNLLFNQVAQTALAVTAAKNSATWSLSTAPAGALVSCSVTVTANSLKNIDSSTANPASVSAALTTQSQSASAAESAYNAAVSANSKSYQKALVDNRAAWRANVDKVRATYLAELTRISGLPYSKANSALKSAALKSYSAAQKKTAADYKASGPEALLVRDLANKAALDAKTAAIVKANSVYGAFIESIGYGVLIP